MLGVSLDFFDVRCKKRISNAGESMTKQPFAPGTVVQCHSGGPTMTVVKHDDNNGVVCTWMQRTGRGTVFHKRTGTFPSFTLSLYKRSVTNGRKR